jgi:hypothetical protein
MTAGIEMSTEEQHDVPVGILFLLCLPIGIIVGNLLEWLVLGK